MKRLLLRAVSFDVFACQHFADFYYESPRWEYSVASGVLSPTPAN
jgi:hypothetical protein